MNREQAIKAIKAGTHVLDIDGYQETTEAIEILQHIETGCWNAIRRYYGKHEQTGRIVCDEINNRPIIKMSDILSLSEVDITDGQEPVTIKEANNPLDSTSETPISEMREEVGVVYLKEGDITFTEEPNMRDYDEELLNEWFEYYYMNPCPANVQEHKRIFLKNRYPNKELEYLLRQREELDKRIEELKGNALD
jgi:hypothetical protein